MGSTFAGINNAVLCSIQCISYRSVRADEVNTDISSEGSRHSFSRQSSESKSPHTKHKWSVETGAVCASFKWMLSLMCPLVYSV